MPKAAQTKTELDDEIVDVIDPPTEQDLPVRSGDVIRFTPPSAVDLDPKPVYLLKVPSLSDRALWRRDMVSRGCAMPPVGMVNDILREGIRAAIIESRQDELLDVVDQMEARQKATNDDVDPNELMALLKKFAAISRDVRRHHPPLAAIEADAQFWVDMQDVVLPQHFLVGWENGPGVFETAQGLVTEHTLELIPRVQHMQIVTRLLGMMSLTRATAKN